MANDELADLRITVSALRRDLDDMKQEKRYFLEHNMELKSQVAKLTEELQLASRRHRSLDAQVQTDTQPPTSVLVALKTTDSPPVVGIQHGPCVTQEVETAPEPTLPGEEVALVCSAPNAGETRRGSSEVEHCHSLSIEVPLPVDSAPVVEVKSEVVNVGAKRAAPTALSSASDHKRKKLDPVCEPPVPAKRTKPLGVYLLAPPQGLGGAAPSPSLRASSSDLNSRRPILPVDEDDALILPPHVAVGYTKDHPRVAIHPTPSKLHVSRDLLRGRFGGSHVQHIQGAHASKNPSGDGSREFIFPLWVTNPHMPLFPGEPGLLLGNRYHDLTNPHCSLFRRHLKNAGPRYQYLGEYELTVVDKMSADVFRGQKEQVKQGWAAIIIGDMRRDCYVRVRAQIVLRKNRSIPSGNHEMDQLLIEREMNAIKAGVGLSITVEDVITAYSRGEEGINITLLKCVDYDWELANAIEAAHRRPADGESIGGTRTHKPLVSPRRGAGRKKYLVSPVKAGDYAMGRGPAGNASMRSYGPISSSSHSRDSARPKRCGTSTWDSREGRRVQRKDRSRARKDDTRGDESDEDQSLTSCSDETDNEYDEVDELLHA